MTRTEAIRAFEVLYVRFLVQQRLQSQVRHSAGDLDAQSRDSDDYRQELAIAIWNAVERMGGAAGDGYYVQVVRTAMDYLRREFLRPSAQKKDMAMEMLLTEDDRISASPHARLEARDSLEALARTVGRQGADLLVSQGLRAAGIEGGEMRFEDAPHAEWGYPGERFAPCRSGMYGQMRKARARLRQAVEDGQW